LDLRSHTANALNEATLELLKPPEPDNAYIRPIAMARQRNDGRFGTYANTINCAIAAWAMAILFPTRKSVLGNSSGYGAESQANPRTAPATQRLAAVYESYLFQNMQQRRTVCLMLLS